MKRFCQFQTLKHRSQIYAQTCPCTRPRHIDTCSVTIIAFNRRPCILHSCHQILKYLRKQRLWCKRILQRKYQEAFSAHLCTKQMSLFFFAKKETSSMQIEHDWKFSFITFWTINIHKMTELIEKLCFFCCLLCNHFFKHSLNPAFLFL